MKMTPETFDAACNELTAILDAIDIVLAKRFQQDTIETRMKLWRIYEYLETQYQAAETFVRELS